MKQAWDLGLVVKGASGVVILELLFLTSSFTHLEQQQAAGEATLPQNQPGDALYFCFLSRSSSLKPGMKQQV